MKHKVKGANGELPIRLGWRGGFARFSIVGGPYSRFPAHDQAAFGVCVRAEDVVGLDFDAHLPIHDFDVPRHVMAVRSVLYKTLTAALEGDMVYVGCMGGWGRTGLFLALLAKCAGVADPVAYVRKHYSARAVETKDQRWYVETIDVSEITVWLRAQGRSRLKRRLFFFR